MKKNILKVCVVTLGVVLAGCLDDDKYALDPSGAKNVVEFLDPQPPSSPLGSIYPVYSNSFTFSTEDSTGIYLSFSGNQTNSSALEIELSIDPVALELYNDQQENGINGNEPLEGDVYTLMDPSYYDIESFTLTIPKGKTKVLLPITVFPDQMDFTKNAALPLRITAVSRGVISQNFGCVLLNLGVRNIYDGIYDITAGNIMRYQAAPLPNPDPVLSGDYVDDLHITMVTQSQFKCAFSPLWKDGSGIGGIDGTNVVVTQDPGVKPETDTIKITATTNPAVKNTPALQNHFRLGYPSEPGFDEDEPQSFLINMDWGSGASTRVITGLKLEYSSARP